MAKTIVVMFDDIMVAQQVVEDLINASFVRSSISFVTNDAHNEYRQYLDSNYTSNDDEVNDVQRTGFRTAVGTLTGMLVGFTPLIIPGIGLAIVAGPLAAGLTRVVVGKTTDGIVKILTKNGIPKEDVLYYAEGIRRGGTLISIQTADTLRARDIMHRYGAIDLHERINVWREAGWQGFDAEFAQSEASTKSSEEMTAINPLDTTAKGRKISRKSAPLTVKPTTLAAEPVHEDEDTNETLPGPEVPTPVSNILPDAPIVTVEEIINAQEELHAKKFPVLEWVKDHPKG